MFGGIGMTEIMVVFVVGLVVLGPKRLPTLARSLGRTLAEFRHASNDLRRDLMDATSAIDLNNIRPETPVGTDEETNSKVPTAAPDDPPAKADAAGPAAKDPSGEEGHEPTGG